MFWSVAVYGRGADDSCAHSGHSAKIPSASWTASSNSAELGAWICLPHAM